MTTPLPTTNTLPVSEPHDDDVVPDDHIEPTQDPDAGEDDNDDDGPA